MKTPPLLIGAALLFWGWQTDLLVVGAAMAVVLEATWFIKARWEFSDDEFRRIWIFSCLVFVAALFYAFNANEGPSNFVRMLDDPNFSTQSRAGTAGARTVISMLRWSPMIFFLFMLTQAYSSRTEIPVATISIFLWRRRRKALKAGLSIADEKKLNLSHPYFGTCLLAASIHNSEVPGYFWGFCALVGWALWPHRSRRLNPITWAATLALVIALGHLGQSGLNRLQQLITNRGAQWLSQFFQRGANAGQNNTAIGEIGRLNASGKIVIRLETQPGQNPPLYLREASYRYCRGYTWYGGSLKTFDTIHEEKTNSTTWILAPGKMSTMEVQIACYLPGGMGLLPLPAGSVRLEHLPAFLLSKNTEGAVSAEGPGLIVFDTHYSPRINLDSPATNIDFSTTVRGTQIKNLDFEVPTNEIFAVNKVIEDLHTNGLSTKQILHRVHEYFETNFTYSLWQEPSFRSRTDADTALARFLLQTRSGHCEYFATATVFLLRQMRIPSRYAVGYIVHEAKGNKYVVRQRDGHAWCLVWDETAKIWNDFDTTPGSRFAEEAKRASSFEWLSDAWSRIRFEIAKFRWGQSELRRYILWALIPILLLLLYQIIFRRSWRRRGRKNLTNEALFDWPGTDSEFYQLERRLAEFIGPRESNETLGDWLARAVKDPELVAVTGPLRELLRLHYRYRFDPMGLDAGDRAFLKQSVRASLQQLAQAQASAK